MTAAVMPTYARMDVAFTHGDGPWLTAADGRRFLDFGTGIAVTALGHAHPHLVAALRAQAGMLWHTSNLYRIPDQERLAERLVEASFADTVFFCNSGAEAMECALKLVRRHHHTAGRPERHRMIVADSGFHGRTLATIAAAGNPKYTTGFGPDMPGFDHVPFGNLNQARMAVGPRTAGIVVEPIQGEGGIRPADAAYLRGLRAMADEYGLLLVFDEVQTGMGRTGHLFAHQAHRVTPDVMALAKGLGGGFPVGACLATARAAAGMTAGVHGSTFGGNPLAMAVANAVMDVMMEPGFLAHVQAMGAELAAALDGIVAQFPGVFAARRGRGLMQGLVCVRPNTEVNRAVFDAGLLLVPAAENTLRVLPPLVITRDHIADACARLAAACTALQKGAADA